MVKTVTVPEGISYKQFYRYNGNATGKNLRLHLESLEGNTEQILDMTETSRSGIYVSVEFTPELGIWRMLVREGGSIDRFEGFLEVVKDNTNINTRKILNAVNSL